MRIEWPHAESDDCIIAKHVGWRQHCVINDSCIYECNRIDTCLGNLASFHFIMTGQHAMMRAYYVDEKQSLAASLIVAAKAGDSEK